MQITIWNHSGNQANYPACNYRKYCSVLWSWTFPVGDVENYWGVRGCHLKRPMLCSWELQCYPGATWASIEDNYIKRSCPSTHLEADEFSLSCPKSGWSWSGELDALSVLPLKFGNWWGISSHILLCLYFTVLIAEWLHLEKISSFGFTYQTFLAFRNVFLVSRSIHLILEHMCSFIDFLTGK